MLVMSPVSSRSIFAPAAALSPKWIDTASAETCGPGLLREGKRKISQHVRGMHNLLVSTNPQSPHSSVSVREDSGLRSTESDRNGEKQHLTALQR